MLHIDRFRKIGRQREEAVVRDVVHPLDDFRNRAARAGQLRPACGTDVIGDLLLGARDSDSSRSRSAARPADWRRAADRPGTGRSSTSKCSGMSSFTRVADRHQPVRQPVAQPVAVQHRHHDIDVGLELDQPFARIGDRPLADALELDAVVLLRKSRPARRSNPNSSSCRKDGSDSSTICSPCRESCRPRRAGQ